MSLRNGGIGDSKFLERKIPRTQKYNNAQHRVDSGYSKSRQAKELEEKLTNYRYRKDELFKRMKVTTLAQLVIQVANISIQDEISEIGSVTTTHREEITSSRSSLQSVINGLGEVDVDENNRPKPASPDPDFLEEEYDNCPYLLLDVRDEGEYQNCHLTTARNFPSAMLARTMNNFSKEMLEFKNCEGKIIILYDEDERITNNVATTMVERGFDNIFVLSGGLKVLAQKFPDGFNNGSFPAHLRPQVVNKHRKPIQLPTVEADMKKRRFSPEDLDKINHYLDESLIPQDTGSRLSRATTQSRVHNNQSQSSSVSSNFSTVSGRRAWR